ncbi:MAG: hypothetical protein ACE5NG_10970 [bacterium]
MSEHGAGPEGVVKLDIETNVQTGEGRIFLNQLNQVSHVLFFRDTEVEFKGETALKTGYVGDCKSVTLYKCPNGFFLFCNAAFGKNNWSAIGQTFEEVLAKVSSKEIKKKLQEEYSDISKAA